MLKFHNKIINGDCLKELKKIPNKSFDLVFANYILLSKQDQIIELI